MTSTEVPVQFWDEAQADSFFVSDAMKSAVGLFWYDNVRGTNSPMPNLTITLDTARGVVVVSDNTN